MEKTGSKLPIIDSLDRRNTFLMTLEGTLFWMGLAFLETNTVVSVFLQQMSGNAALAGLAVTLMNFMPTLSQFFFGMFIHRLKSQHRFMIIIAAISRPLILLMIPILLGGVTGIAAAWCFLGLYGLFMLADGFVGMIWSEISARTLRPQKRGMVASTQRLFAGLFGLIAGTIIRSILSGLLPSSVQFSIIFGLAGLCFTLNVFVVVMMRDHPGYRARLEVPVPDMRSYIARFAALYRESRVFRQIMGTRILYLLGLIASPLYILYADVLGIPVEMKMYLFYMPVIGQMLGGLFWARISMAKGYPLVIRLSHMINLAVAIMSMVLWLVPVGIAGGMILLSLCMSLLTANVTAFIGYNNHLIDSVSDEKRPSYYILQNVLLAPFTFGATAAGAIAQTAGYGFVFLVILGVSIAGVFFSQRYFGERKPN